MFRTAFINRLKDFQEDARGAILIIFSLTLFVMLIVIGLAIDVGRGLRAGTAVAAAVDSAVLAGAKGLRLQNLTDAEITTLVSRMFNENLNNSGGDLPSINSLNVVIDRGNSSVELNVDADIRTTFGQLAGIPNLPASRRGVAIFEKKDLEVALQLDVTGSMAGSKLAALKLATKDLVDTLIPDDLSLLQGQNVRIGYAPYDYGVNAGSLASAMNGGVNAPNDCVYERINTSNQDTENFPIGASALKTKLSAPSAGTCSNSQLLPMTSDKALLKSTVDDYQHNNGYTAGHLGTSFAWYLLSPQWASIWPAASQPVAYNSGNTAKIAILMTDGEYNTIGGVGDPSNNVVPSQNFAKATCTAMKAQGIIVYTVGFQLSETNATETLQNCASSGDHFYRADDADALRQAFRDIAQDIAPLRLSE